MWLTNGSVYKVSSSGGFSAGSTSTSAVGNINVNAMGVGHSSSARWLLRVGDLQSLTGVWLPSSSKSAGASTVTFTSTADLTPAAKSGSERTSRYLGTG